MKQIWNIAGGISIVVAIAAIDFIVALWAVKLLAHIPLCT